MSRTRFAAIFMIIGTLLFPPPVPARAAVSIAHPWTTHGVLRIGVFRDIDSINPLLSGQTATSDIAQLIFSGLLGYDDRGNLIPDVALAVPTLANGGINADGTTITYHLRHGVVFSDGVPLTAADVVYTWRQIMNSKNNVPYRFPNDQASSVDALDPFTVIVRLKEPSAPFISSFMVNGQRGSILPKHLLEQYADLNQTPFNLRPVGSGPFTVARWQPGVLLSMAANPRYWRGLPKLREIRYLIIPQQNSLLSALRSHEVDLYWDMPEQQYALVKSLEGFRVTKTPIAAFEHITFNCRRAPFDDVRVRRAVAFAIDWRALAENVYLGLDSPGMADIPPASWAADPAVKPYSHDLAKARALLSQAGWTPGSDGVLQKLGKALAVDISTTNGATTRASAEVLIQQNLRDVGIDVQVRNYPASMLFAAAGAGGILNTGKFDLALYGWVKNADPDDTQTIGPDYVPPNGGNHSGYADRQIGQWLHAATTHYLREQRRQYYWQIQQRIYDAVPIHTIVWQSTISAFNSDLKRYRPASAGSDFWNAWEWEI